jgi:hypothetical protein
MKGKKGAMEMSMGTIVTIVLLMSVMVLGFFFVGKIKDLGGGAIDSVGTATEAEINKLFSEEGGSLILTPVSGEVTVKRGDTPKGFGFRLNNEDTVPHTYTYELKVAMDETELQNSCGPTMTTESANSMIMVASGTINQLGAGQSMPSSKMIRFNVPSTAPKCSIQYELNIEQDGSYFDSPGIFLTLK